MKLKLYFFALLFLQQFISFGQTLDQSNTIISASTSGVSIGQSFTPGLTGKLSKFIYFNNFVSSNTYPLNFKLKIYQGGGNTGTLLGEQSFTLTSTTPNAEFEIVISSIINVTAGDLYTAYFIPDDGMSGILFSSTAANSYPGGSLYNGNSPFVPGDLYFKTFVTVPATHLNFDGVDDFITLPNESFFDFTNQMTVEVWVKSSVAPEQWDALVIKGDNSWRLHLNSTGTVNFTCSGTTSSQVNSTSSVTDGNWHHVVGTFGENSIKIYIDGVLENVVTTSGNINNTVDQVLIGNNPTFGPRHFNGNMEDVRIWNVARTAEQINGSRNCELQGTETGLVAYYNFNQGIDAADNTSITSLIDATANANNGTLVNFTKTGAVSNFLAGSPVTTGSIIPSVATVTTPVTYNQGATATALTATTGTNGTGLVWYTTATGGTGATTAPTPSTATVGSTSYWVSSTNANGCESARTEIVVNILSPATYLNFGATTDFVDCGNSTNLNITGNKITLEAYVKFNSFVALSNIINNGGINSSGYMLRVGANGEVNFVLGSGVYSQVNSPNNSLILNTWHHVAAVFDGANAKIYIDGIEVASQPFSVSITTSNLNLNLGRDPQNPTRYLDAALDEVRIWNRALPLSEIQNNMDCELPSPSTQNGLVAYYQLNQGFDGADNTSITTLTDASGNANIGTLTNFARTGTTSNFLAGSPIVTGTNCAVLSTSNFEIANNIKMYPNPTRNFVTVEVNNLTNAKLQVLDITGKILMNQALNTTSNNVDVQHLPSGMYLFKVSSKEGTSTGKIIKN